MRKVIQLDSLEIFYQEYGSGNKNILLLHGWGQSSAFWQDFVKRFSDKHHLYVLDIPGFGMSQEPPSIWTIQDYAIFIQSFVAKIKITNPILVGHSFGGRIAIAYASQFPVKKLVLYSTGGGLPEGSPLKIINKYILISIGKYFFPNFLYKSHGFIFRPKGYKNKIIVNKKRSRRMLDIYSQPSQYLHAALKKISVKTLIIVGERDYITRPFMGVQMHKIVKNSELVEVPRATHFAHIEAPDIFYTTVEKFIDENTT